MGSYDIKSHSLNTSQQKKKILDQKITSREDYLMFFSVALKLIE